MSLDKLEALFDLLKLPEEERTIVRQIHRDQGFTAAADYLLAKINDHHCDHAEH